MRGAVLVAVALAACGEDPPPPTYEHPIGTFTIPDPGLVPHTGAWDGTGVDNRAPDRAVPIGVISSVAPPYITDDSAAFFTFRSSPGLAEITLRVNFDAELLHLHDGDGLMFGAEIAPKFSDDTDRITRQFDLTPDHIYVVEVGMAGDGFF